MYSTLAKKMRRTTLTSVLFIVGAFPALAALPNDIDLAKQSYLWRVQAPAAWELVRNSIQRQDVVIAILDTGVAIDHPDLANRIWRNTDEVPGDGIDNDENSYIDDVQGWDFLASTPDPRPKLTDGYVFDAVNHGTVVAGVIAAEADNTFGIAGASFRAKIMPLRVLDSTGAGNTLLLAQAIDYAVENGADIVNLSLVGEVNDRNLAASIDAAYRAGVAVVAASGNQEHAGVNLNLSPRYPVCETDAINRVLGVAAVDETSKLAAFSNYGSQCIDISAPGVNFYSTAVHVDGNAEFKDYYSGGWSGTSVAAPLISSAIALIRQVAPTLSLADQYRLVLSNTSSLESANPQYQDLGNGMLDMLKVVQAALSRSRSAETAVILAQGRGFEPRVKIKDKNGIIIAEFMAYARGFRGGVRAASGDINGDGTNEIVTVPASNGGPHVRIFDSKGTVKGQFMAYPVSFNGGLSIAVGDVNGDGTDEIITAPNNGGKNGPEVRVFNGKGELLNGFFAYAKQFSGGVNIAVGDVDADGVADIVTTPASSGGPHVRIFDRSGGLKGQFMAFAPEFRGGLQIAVGDVDSDGRHEIASVQDIDRNVQLRIFSARGEEKNRFPLYPGFSSVEQASGILVGDYTGDGQADILSYALTPGTDLTLFDYFGRVIDTVGISGTSAEERSLRYSFSLL